MIQPEEGAFRVGSREPGRRCAFFPIALACLGAACAAGCGGCDPVALEVLRADLVLAPAQQTVVAWIGHEVTTSFTVANRGRAPLELGAASVAIDGDASLDAALDVEVAIERGRLSAGESGVVSVTIRATAPATSDVVLRLETLANEVETAVLRVEARAPPPCEPAGPCERIGGIEAIFSGQRKIGLEAFEPNASL